MTTLKKGDIVTIYNSTISGEEVVEGKAELRNRLFHMERPDTEWQCWQVRFLDDRVDGQVYNRFVDINRC